jgi:tetratricopeptide (TPR) repeat protein
MNAMQPKPSLSFASVRSAVLPLALAFAVAFAVAFVLVSSAVMAIATGATADLFAQSRSGSNAASRRDADLGTRDLGVRYLKLGNTYREARNYDLAQLYIKKGLDMVRNQGSRYWEATGYEYLGLIYRDMGERDLALEYLRVSQGIFASILNTRDGVGSDDALRLVIADIERGADRLPASQQAPYTPYPSTAPRVSPSVSPGPYYNPYRPSPEVPLTESDRLRSDNQRLQDVNRQLNNRVADLEDRIRRLETDVTSRSLNMNVPNSLQNSLNVPSNLTPTPDISECKRDIEAIARYRESVLWSNNYTPQNLQNLGARVSDQNTKVNGTIVTGYLKKGESVKIELDVNPGIYAIVADGCSGKARDIDVRIINQRGVVLEKKDIRFSTSADVSTESNRITETRTTNADGSSTTTTERPANANNNNGTATNPNNSTNATTTVEGGGDLRVRPSSTREPLARLAWNAEYSGTHTFLVTMYDCEPEGAYFCFVIGRK